jgi:hypothetical protein
VRASPKPAVGMPHPPSLGIASPIAWFIHVPLPSTLRLPSIQKLAKKSCERLVLSRRGCFDLAFCQSITTGRLDRPDNWLDQDYFVATHLRNQTSSLLCLCCLNIWPYRLSCTDRLQQNDLNHAVSGICCIMIILHDHRDLPFILLYCQPHQR